MADGTQIKITAVDATTAAFRSVQGNINSLTGSLRSIAGPLAAAFSVAGVTAFAKQMIDVASRLDDVSQQTGIAADRLSALGNAAKINGSSADQMNSALVRLNRAISEASSGSKEQLDAFAALGISMADLRKMSPEETLYAISDAFAGANDGANKTAIAIALLGKSGAELIPTLNRGATELRNFNSSFTNEQIKQLAQAGDNLDEIAINIQKIAAAPTAKVTGFFNDLIKRFSILNDLAKEQNKSFWGKLFSAPKDEINARIAEMQDAFDEEKATEFWKSVMGKGKKELSTIKSADFTTFNEAVAEKLFEFDYKNFGKEAQDFVTFNEEIANRLAEVDYKAAIATTGLEDYAKATKNLANQVDQVAVRAMMNLEDALLGVMSGTMSVKDAFKSMAASIIQDLIRIQIQRSITGPIADALGGLFSAQNTGQGFFGGIGARALGGSVMANEAYMVGEKGPELFVPGKTGAIVPNNQLGGSGAVVNQTINISTGVSQTVRAEIQGMLPRIMEATKAAVADSKRRGGSYGAMLA